MATPTTAAPAVASGAMMMRPFTGSEVTHLMVLIYAGLPSMAAAPCVCRQWTRFINSSRVWATMATM